MMRWITGLACVGALAACATTQAAPPSVVDPAAVARIDATLVELVERGEVAGVSALIFEGGEEAYYGAFGYADREAQLPMARDTLVQIFSMTKPITGVALMSLYEDGAFELDDPVAMYAPEFADMTVYVGDDADGEAIYEEPKRPLTIRDLTRHTSGFYNGGDHGPVGDLFRAADPTNWENTLDVMAARIGSVPLIFHPGDEWLYGPSVTVQAFLVQRISGRPYAEYLQDEVLTPLGLTETSYYVEEARRRRLAAAYNIQDDGTLERRDDETNLALNTQRHALTLGGYGIASTLDDYMTFARMLLNEGEYNGGRILESETVRLMATSHLSEDVTERSWLPDKGQVGFGIDFAVRTAPPLDADENYGVVGEFFWDGAASTLFWVDPANDLVAVLFVQFFPFDRNRLHKPFRDAVYGPVWPDEGETSASD